MSEKPKQRGGLRNPPGGRPPKPESEKYRKYSLKLPPDVIEWLEANVKNRNGFIVDVIRAFIASNSTKMNDGENEQ